MARRNDVTPRVLQRELTRVYVDPTVGPQDMLAYCPEIHASSRCHRAIRKGHHVKRIEVGQAAIWCDTCTCVDPEVATLRLGPNGWEPV